MENRVALFSGHSRLGAKDEEENDVDEFDNPLSDVVHN